MNGQIEEQRHKRVSLFSSPPPLPPTHTSWDERARISRTVTPCKLCTDRNCRVQFAFEPVQPIVLLIGVTTSRVPGRDGLTGMRVGEAGNPGPPAGQLALTADDSMGVKSALEYDSTQLDSDHASE